MIHHLHALDGLTLYGRSFLQPRSQSENTARLIVDWFQYTNKFNVKNFYGTFAITPEYTRTFRPARLAQYFFATDTLSISGSEVDDRGELDLLADYFGLSPSFQSTARLIPLMQNYLVDFSAYFGWKDYYFRIHAPFVCAQTRIRMHERVIDNGSGVEYPAGYMTQNPLPAPFTCFTNAMRNPESFGDVQARTFGNFCCTKTHTAFSDVRMALGWNMVNHDYGHFGLDIRAATPNGTKPNAHCLFEPIIGNGRHWILGAGFTGHGLIWEKDGREEWNIIVDAHLQHLFNSRQLRSFDITGNGFASRYILMKQFSDGAYTRTSLPAINATTLNADVSINLEIEGAIMFAYTYDCFEFDIGYNGWLRTHEIITCPSPFPANTYGMKGIQDVTIGALPSPATQSTATIFGNNLADQAAVADPNPPVLISPTNIYLNSAATPQQMTHKIFWHLSYNADDKVTNLLTNSCTAPWWITNHYIGFGGEVEFEGFIPKYDFRPNHIAMSQWGLWIKAGVAY